MTNIQDLETTLGYTFKDKSILLTALTHRSYLNENKKIQSSNERLEFLGDSVLSLLVSTMLFQKFPDLPEGKLTTIRSLLVKTKTLGDLSKKLGFGDFLLMSKGEEKSGGRSNQSLLADTFEAVLGALYLDGGLNSAKSFLEKNLFPELDTIQENAELSDYKSSLQEITQEKSKISPTYKVVKEQGPDHDKTFTVAVYLETKLLAEGVGKSKQEAEQNAAKLALNTFTV